MKSMKSVTTLHDLGTKAHGMLAMVRAVSVNLEEAEALRLSPAADFPLKATFQ